MDLIMSKSRLHLHLVEVVEARFRLWTTVSKKQMTTSGKPDERVTREHTIYIKERKTRNS